MDKLNWERVRQMIKDVFSAVPITITVYDLGSKPSHPSFVSSSAYSYTSDKPVAASAKPPASAKPSAAPSPTKSAPASGIAVSSGQSGKDGACYLHVVLFPLPLHSLLMYVQLCAK